jgi:hypothetical protein
MRRHQASDAYGLLPFLASIIRIGTLLLSLSFAGRTQGGRPFIYPLFTALVAIYVTRFIALTVLVLKREGEKITNSEDPVLLG